jgi:hypothetical protein
MLLHSKNSSTLAAALLAISAGFYSAACKKKKKGQELAAEQAQPPAPPPVKQPERPGPGPGPNPPPVLIPGRPEILGWKPAIPTVGDEVTISGRLLDQVTSLALTGAEAVDYAVSSESSASFRLAAAERTGPVRLTAEYAAGSFSSSMYLRAEDDGIPIFTGDPSDMCSGSSFYDNQGVLRNGTRECGNTQTKPCAGSGDSDCIATAGTVAVLADELKPENIRVGSSIGGVLGAYPSAAYPMVPAVPAFGGELGPALAEQRAGEVGFFDQTGAYIIIDLAQAGDGSDILPGVVSKDFRAENTLYLGFTVAGDSNLHSGNIREGITVFGVAGSVGSSYAQCERDNEAGCVATDSFPSVESAKISDSGLAYGLSVAGIDGRNKFCRNGANTSLFDNTDAPAQPGLDYYDSIDDYNNWGYLPGESAFGPANHCAESNWNNPAGDFACTTGSADCMFRDLMTGIYWTTLSPAGTAKTWQQAIDACEDLEFGGFNDWRLPTQKELFQAYINGVAFLYKKFRNFGSTRVYHWAATSVSTPSGSPPSFPNAWLIDLSNGSSLSTQKNKTREYRCVR